MSGAAQESRTLTTADVQIATLSLRMETIEAAHVDFQVKFSKAEHYTHVLYEDLITRLAKMENSNVRFEANLLHVNGNGDDTNKRLDGIEARLRTLERMGWTAIGACIAVTGISSFFGWQVLKILLK